MHTSSSNPGIAVFCDSGYCPELVKLHSDILPQAKGLVFDCDGTLLDTMPIYFESWKRACEDLELDLPVERFYSFAGVPVRDIFQILIDEQHAHREPTRRVTADYCERVKRAYHEQIVAENTSHDGKRMKPNPIDVVVQNIVLKYHGKVPMAVASSGWRDHVIEGLERNGLLKFFDVIVTADDDDMAKKNPKPYPDIFLLASERLGISPQQCVGFEDADLGMEAIQRANFLYACDVRKLFMYPRNVERRMSSSLSSFADTSATSTHSSSGESYLS